MGKRDSIEPAGPQDDKAKQAQERRHQKRQDDFDQADKDENNGES